MFGAVRLSRTAQLLLKGYNVISEFKGEYRFLSNFHYHNNTTVEHLYQAAKTNDAEWKAKILTVEKPGQARRLGQQCPMRPTWEKEKLDIMRGLLWNKFLIPELASKLLATGDEELIEGNNWGDTYWGVCEGVGLNWLGKILMEVREKLRNV